MALVSLVLDFGFDLSPAVRGVLHALDGVLVALLLVDAFSRFAGASDRRAWLRTHWIEALILPFLAVEVVTLTAVSGGTAPLRIYVIAVQTYLILRLLLDAARANERLLARINPAFIPLGGFLLLIAAGTALLLVPAARAPGAPALTFMDALFTSTSASCVTGLSVRDVGSELSFRGQLVLLGLIQLGGLGPVTLALFLTFLEVRRLRVREATLLRDLMSAPMLGDVGLFLRRTVAITLSIELAGAGVLWLGREAGGEGPLQRAWWAVFHSVSAFCNAGFGLHSNSLSGQVGSPVVCLTVAALVVAGGLGFPVLIEVLRAAGSLFRAPLRPRGLLAADSGPPFRFSLQTKLVLAATGVLLVGGAVLFYAAERNSALAPLDFRDALVASVFQSAMPRTAGFNSLDIGRFAMPTLLLFIVLMAIGAAPASTGGGIKVTAVAVQWLTALAVIRNRPVAEAFHRRVPQGAVQAAVTIAFLYGIVAVLVVAGLAFTQRGIPFLDVLFESISALSTVGLSTGVTPKFDSTGRLILCVAMLAGRIGPLAVVWTVVFRSAPLRYEYPEEPVTVS